MRKKPGEIRTENDVKERTKGWYRDHHAWSYAPIQNGMGEHGIPDRVGCVPVVVTEAMVGKKIGLFVAVECKAPGRRQEPRRGMSANQDEKRQAIRDAGGIAICADGAEDLQFLSLEIGELVGAVDRRHPVG